MEKRTTVPSTAPQWVHDTYAILPSGRVIGCISADFATGVSLVCKTEDETSILDALKSHSAGVKIRSTEVNGTTSAKQTKRFGSSKDCPLLKFGHGNSTGLPPFSVHKRVLCAKVDVHAGREQSSTRETHIHADCPCKFGCTFRFFADRPLFLVCFEFGEHIHTCSRERDYLLPIRPSERMLLFRRLLEHRSAKAFFDKEFPALLKDRANKGVVQSSFDRMTFREIRNFAIKFKIDEKVPSQGEEDFAAVRGLLLEQQTKHGAIIAFKPPGYSTSDSRVILPESLKPLLTKDDLFIFLMTPLQKALLREFGAMVATDGTHSVFSYNNIKLISVHVTSFQPGQTSVTERGFPVAIVLVTSERESIHTCIASILSASVPEWKPRLLMTDMAFSAYNGWSKLFPDLKWLWCIFHVWQAWIRRLRSMPNGGGFDKDTWSHVKGRLIKEVKDLISPKSEMTSEEFKTCSGLIEDLLHAVGESEIAALWASYRSQASHWALHERWAAIRSIFPEANQLPMLARSNNPVEAFFSVLKYHILDGRALRTLSEFFGVWGLYETRLYTNAVRAGVIDHLKGLHRNADSDVDELFAIEDDEALLVRDALEADEVKEDEEEDETVWHAQQIAKQLQSYQRGLDCLDNLLVEATQKTSVIRNRPLLPDCLAERIAELNRLQEQLKSYIFMAAAFEGASSNSTLSINGLAMIAGTPSFVRQAANFGPTDFKPVAPPLFNPRLSAPPLVDPRTSQQTTSEAPNAGPSQSGSGSTFDPSVHAPFLSVAAASTQVDVERLFKRVKQTAEKPTKPAWLHEERPFADFVTDFLNDPVNRARKAESLKIAETSRFPCLRAALSNNTSVRIRAVMFDIFGLEFPKSISKGEILTRSLAHLLSVVSVSDTVAKTIADVGIFHTTSSEGTAGSLILLESNSTASTGEACVAACMTLRGWVVSPVVSPLVAPGNAERTLVRQDSIPTSHIYWGRLVEKRRQMTIKEAM